MHSAMTGASFSLAHDISHAVSENYIIHSHPFYEIYCFIEGDVYFLYGGAEYLMEPDTLIIVAPNVLHGIKVLSRRSYERFTMHFTPELISPMRRETLLSRLPAERSKHDEGEKLDRIWFSAGYLGIDGIIKDYDRMVSLPKEAHHAAAGVIVETALMRLNLYASHAPKDAEQKYQAGIGDFDEALAYIHTNFTQKLRLEDIANRFFISKNKLNQKFGRQTGFTVMEYVNRCRLKYARQLLLNGFTAAEACQACGYGDYTAFYRAYARLIGNSPKCDKRETRVKPQSLLVKGSLPFNALDAFSALHDDGRGEAETTIWDQSGAINISPDDLEEIWDKA